VLREKCKGNKSEEGAGIAVEPPFFSHCSADTFMKFLNRKKVRWSTLADRHLVTAFEVSFVGKRGKQPQSGVVEESRFPEVCRLHGNCEHFP
jgi:hypothetical protein